jgi:hypothetical protein
MPVPPARKQASATERFSHCATPVARYDAVRPESLLRWEAAQSRASVERINFKFRHFPSA